MTTEQLPLSKGEALRYLDRTGNHIPEDALGKIVPLLSDVTFLKGDRLTVQGEPGDGMYFIAAGKVIVTRSAFGMGDTKELATLTRGDLVGEMALVRNQPRNATVTALEEVTAYTLSRDNWIHIQAFYPGLTSKIEQVAQRREEYNQGRRVP